MRLTRVLGDRRGAGMTEYAIILFVILVLAAVVFKLVGGRVKGAGSAATAQFEGTGVGDNGAGAGAGGGGDKSGGAIGGKDDKTKDDKGAAGDQAAAEGQGQTGGQAQAGAGAGAGGASHGGKLGKGTGATGDGSAPIQPEEDEHRPPIMKILAGVLVAFFAIAAYFVFRKGKQGA